jgi:hypothetical protein
MDYSVECTISSENIKSISEQFREENHIEFFKYLREKHEITISITAEYIADWGNKCILKRESNSFRNSTTFP